MFQGKRVSALLLAGGSGSRFQASGNKVYSELLGRQLIEYSWEILQSEALVDELVLVIRKGEENEAARLSGPKPCRIVAGGAERKDSVRAGLAAVTGDFVLIQDAARPLLEHRFIRDCLDAAVQCPGVSVAVPSKDTVKLSDRAGRVVMTTDRRNTWIVQTPQCFETALLRRLHEQAGSDPSITDDCMLLEKAGYPVQLVMGAYTNIKVTTPEDRLLAEAFLRARQLP